MTATPFTSRPPKPLEPEVSRYDAHGRPTQDQRRYELQLQQYLINLVAALGTFQAVTDASNLPTADPHKVGQVWSNSGILTVSAG